MASKPSAPSSARRPAWLTPVLTHAGIILAFFVFTLIYFSPVVFDGKVLNQSDIIQFEGMAKESRDFRSQTGEEALWVSRLFSGMPAYQAGTLYPGNLVNSLNKALWLGTPRPVGYVFLTFLGFYILLQVMGVNPWISGIGAAAYALSSYFFIILEAGHTSKANTISFMAPVVAGILLTYRGKWLLGGALTALAVSLQLNANHPQITYYLLIMLLIMGVVMLTDAVIHKKIASFLKETGILVLAAVLGLGPNISRLWTLNEYSEESLRGKSELTADEDQPASGLDKEYALRWSYGIAESLTLLVPDAFGGSSQVRVDKSNPVYKDIQQQFGKSEQVQNLLNNFPGYWGDQPFTSGPVYAGAIVCFLFVLGCIIVKGPVRLWALVATGLFLILSWGRNFPLPTDLFFAYMPLYNKFRAVAMMLVIVEFTMPLLGFLALHQLFKASAEERLRLLRPTLVAAGITGGIALLLAVGGSALFSFEGAPETEEQLGQLADFVHEYRAGALQADAFRSFAFIALAAALLVLYLRNSLQAVWVYAGLALLVFVDMVPVNLRYLNKDSYITKRQFEQSFRLTEADKFILKDTDPNYRVLNLTRAPFDDALTSYYHKSIGGYHAAKLRRYQDLISRYIQPEMGRLLEVLRAQPTDSSIRATMDRLPVINMLNTRYIIINPQGMPIQNMAAMGNAWFVREVKTVTSADEEIAAIGQVNLRQTAVVDISSEDGMFGPQVQGLSLVRDSTARISLTAFTPNVLTYQSVSTTEGVAVFSEIYYNSGKGWQAYLDGQKVPHFRTDYVLRGMKIPAGTHEIVFKMEPASFYQGETLSLIFSILLLLLVAGAAFLAYRQQAQAA
ncbi:MAG: hypothetical protein SF053_07150 [Bacteroidia bacterium]|nr:hypothetical protein [Bacteroidia bacterium]